MNKKRITERDLTNMLRDITRAGRAYEESTNTTDVALGSLRVQRRVQLNILLSEAEDMLREYSRGRVDVDPGMIREQLYRSPSSDNAVSLTHIPTGVAAEWGQERSYHLNKDIALAILRRKLEHHGG